MQLEEPIIINGPWNLTQIGIKLETKHDHTKSFLILCRKRISMLTGFQVSLLASKCVFYRPEHSANRGHLKLTFEGLLECKDEINQRTGAQSR